MPRIQRSRERKVSTRHLTLVGDLAEELIHAHESGQPRIEEETFPKTNLRKVFVLWDKWEDVAEVDRSEVILQAYERAEGKESRERIALVSGWTFPEAYELDHLPYRVYPAVRPDDAVTLEQCHKAMCSQGASMLFDSGKPELRFSTQHEAEECIERLRQELPGSDLVWLTEKDLSPRD